MACYMLSNLTSGLMPACQTPHARPYCCRHLKHCINSCLLQRGRPLRGFGASNQSLWADCSAFQPSSLTRQHLSPAAGE